MNSKERRCVLTVDEMSITPLDFDKSSGTIIGEVTLPGHQGKATHALVFMLAGKLDVKHVKRNMFFKA